MTWQIVVQTFTSGLAAIGVWFIYELLKEYKQFKEKSDREFLQNKKEHNDIDLKIGTLLNKVEEMRYIVEDSMRDLSRDISTLKQYMTDSKEQYGDVKDFLRKQYLMSKGLYERTDKLEKDLQGLRASSIRK